MLVEGQTVGSYRIGATVGAGGFATVFRAVHEALGSNHAVKVLRPDLVSIEEIRLRFLDEARIQARLQHPNIVRVTDILALPGVAAIVMDLAPGEPLSTWIAARRAPPSPGELREIILPMLDALGYAHDNGVVHRDLKPENVLLETGPRGVLVPRVVDFGIAKVRGDLASRTNKRSTIADRRMGTSGYMSPEQIRSAKEVDSRSDIFALGIILLELATLKHPFERASEFDTMHAVVNGDFVIPQDLWDRDPAIASAIRVALQPDPAGRFDTCTRFAEAIGAADPRVPAGPARPVLTPPPTPAAEPEGAAAAHAQPTPPKLPPPQPHLPAPNLVPPKPPTSTLPAPKAPPNTEATLSTRSDPTPAPRSSGGCGVLAGLGLIALIAVCCARACQEGGTSPSSDSIPSLAPSAAETPEAPEAPPLAPQASVFRASGDDGPALIVGIGKTFAPMFDTSTSPPTGFDVDLADELARRLGKREASLRPLDSVRAAAAEGTVDLSIAAISVTPERELETLFSAPYLEPALVTVGLPERVAPENGVLTGFTCANVHEQYDTAAAAAGCARFAVRSVNKALAAVQAGEADLLVLDVVEAGQLPPPWTILGTPIGSDRYAVAMQPGNLDLKLRVDQALADMRADGTLTALEERNHIYGLPRDPAVLPDEDADPGAAEDGAADHDPNGSGAGSLPEELPEPDSERVRIRDTTRGEGGSTRKLVEQGWKAIEASDYSKAHGLFDRALQAETTTDALYGRAYANERLGDAGSAVADYCSALAGGASFDMQLEIEGGLRRIGRSCP